jgi:Co/Zn/Cd efflux system component
MFSHCALRSYFLLLSDSLHCRIAIVLLLVAVASSRHSKIPPSKKNTFSFLIHESSKKLLCRETTGW